MACKQTKKLRVALVGIGGMGNIHLDCHVANSKVEVVGLCDLNTDKAAYARDRVGLSKDVPVFEDFKEMIDTIKPDAVDIATPNDFHSIVAIYALERGIHVFCEKPDAINAVEAQKMKEASEKSGAVLMVMRNNRYVASAQYAKDYIKNGNAGEIYSGRCGWIRRRGIPGKGGWFTTKAKSGGGPLIDLGVHMIDLAMWMMGNPKPVSVSGCTFNKFADDDSESDSVHSAFGEAKTGGTFDVEDSAMGFIRFENGACLQIEFNWASNIKKEQFFVELRGDKAGISWGSEGFMIHTEENGKQVDLKPETVDVVGHHADIIHFVDIIVDGKEPDYVPEQGLNMMKILDAIYESAKVGHEIRL